MADERFRFLQIQKATHSAIATGRYLEGMKKIGDLLKGECRPEDHREPGYDTLAKRLADGQASRSPRRTGIDTPKKKQRVAQPSNDRQERTGSTRRKTKANDEG